MADVPVHEACKRGCAMRLPGRSLVDTLLTCIDACDLLAIEEDGEVSRG